VEALGDEVDRADVFAAVSKRTTELVVEAVDVATVQAGVGDAVAKFICHLVHEAEGASAGGLGEPHVVGLEPGERVGR
jgi:hypothetical protein